MLEEVGHSHVTCVRSIYQNFLDTFHNYPKGIDIIQSASGLVESKYPVNPVQPLGYFGCRAA